MYSFVDACSILNIKDDVSSLPAANLIPSQKPFKLNTILLIDKDMTLDEYNSIVSHSPALDKSFNAEFPFNAGILKANWLTKQYHDDDLDKIKWSESRNVIEVIVSIKDSGIEYSPGDSIGVFAPNPQNLVMEVIKRLKLAHPAASADHPSTCNLSELSETTIIRTSCLPSGFYPTGTTHITLIDLLRNKIDLVGAIRKLSLMSLIEFCTDDKDKITLQWLCSKGETGKRLWLEFVEKQCLGIAEFLLRVVPSCKPPLAVLLSCCNTMRPRYYSICSSPLVHPHSVSIAFSLERFCGTFGSDSNSSSIDGSNTSASNCDNQPSLPVNRSGLCTQYLYELCQPWLLTRPVTTSQSANTALDDQSISLHSQMTTINTVPNNLSSNSNDDRNVRVKIFHKPTLNFRLPGNIGLPLILIGPGTGVAPFMGFLQHRQMQSKSHYSKNRSGVPNVAALPASARVSVADTTRKSVNVSCGVWRGNVEFEDSGELALPAESGTVGTFIETIPPGPIHLFFGCRGPQDYLFEFSLNDFLSQGVLTSLEVAMSRFSKSSDSISDRFDNASAGSGGKIGEYVTDRLRCRGKELVHLICHKNACVYICGDGNRMAKDVHQLFVELLQLYGTSATVNAHTTNVSTGLGNSNHLNDGESATLAAAAADSSSEEATTGMSAEVAEHFIKEMKLRKRYLLDIWS